MNGPAPPIRSRRHPGKPESSSGLAVLFAYLFLVALYESWTIPIPVLLSVVVGVLGSFIALWFAGLIARSLWPDRPCRADRARRQERHSDRRIRQGAARGRHRHCRSRGARRADALPRRDDDVDCLHPWPTAARHRHRRGRRSAAATSAPPCSAACWRQARSAFSWCRCSTSCSKACASASSGDLAARRQAQHIRAGQGSLSSSSSNPGCASLALPWERVWPAPACLAPDGRCRLPHSPRSPL